MKGFLCTGLYSLILSLSLIIANMTGEMWNLSLEFTLVRLDAYHV